MSRLMREMLLELPPAEVFIESGTYEGESLAVASSVFGRCFSIELMRDYCDAARRRLYAGNVTIMHGSSRDLLCGIIDPEKLTMFWLDAHFSGGNRNEMDITECPLMDELGVIRSFQWRIQPTILIDDSFMFTDRFWTKHHDCHLFNREQWPTLSEIESAIPYHTVCERGDILYCIPK